MEEREKNGGPAREEEATGGEADSSPAGEAERSAERWRSGWAAPFSELHDLVGDFLEGVRIFPPGAGRAPRIDMVRTAEEYRIFVDLPGVRKDDLEVSTVGDEITISGKRRRPQLAEGAEVIRTEREYGRFRRTLHAPADVDTARVRAKLEDGVLRLTLPRRTEAEKKQIDIET
ncbi:MAG: Hsp20/alpha crystallin family protein [Gemmatimonadota bacterium]